MDFMSTVKGSLLEGFYPAGWDMAKIDACCEKGVEREEFWNEKFSPIECISINDFDTFMGHEIAMQVKETYEQGRKLAIILPVGPMGMYKWAAYFLNEWKIPCDHVTTFNMDEWADGEGNTLSSDNPASFEYSMKEAFFGKLNSTVPENQRNFATKTNLPTYPEKLTALKAEGAKLVLVYGIGRMCHIAFWGRILPRITKMRTSGKRLLTALAQSCTRLPLSRTPLQALRAEQRLCPAVPIQ